MADGYWRSGGLSKEQPVSVPPYGVKRPNSDSEMSSGHHMSSYYAHDNEMVADRVAGDTDFVNASYERYLRSAPISSYGEETGRSIDGLDELQDINDLRALAQGGSDPAVTVQSRFMGVGGSVGGSDPGVAAQSQFMGVGGRPEIPLPPDSSSTLFVDGVPANCTRREVSHIFRPFVGYKEVRLVKKEPRHPGGNPVVFCFVDFQSPAHAATAMDALQGYIFDEDDRDSCHLRLQFARSPGARSGGGHYGKR